MYSSYVYANNSWRPNVKVCAQQRYHRVKEFLPTETRIWCTISNCPICEGLISWFHWKMHGFMLVMRVYSTSVYVLQFMLLLLLRCIEIMPPVARIVWASLYTRTRTGVLCVCVWKRRELLRILEWDLSSATQHMTE